MGIILRGGSWYYYGSYCAVADVFNGNPNSRNGGYGFRLVLGGEL